MASGGVLLLRGLRSLRGCLRARPNKETLVQGEMQGAEDMRGLISKAYLAGSAKMCSLPEKAGTVAKVCYWCGPVQGN